MMSASEDQPPVQPEDIEDDKKSVWLWDKPITIRDVLARIDEANRREAEAEMELDYDWGGDGSNLYEPVRAHVEAALVPTDAPYPPPLDELLRVGDASEHIARPRGSRRLA